MISPIGRLAPAIAMIACIGMWSSLASAQESERTWTPAQQEVIDAVKNGPVGIESDFDGWADRYHSDWSYWRVGAENTRGRDKHMQLVRDYIEGGAKVAGFELEPVDVIIRGDTALLRANMTETLIEANGETRIVHYSSADLLVRQDGAWRQFAANVVYTPAEDQ